MNEGSMSAASIAVTVVGDDRPGIVAAVAKVLYEAGCNLEDVTSTILRGHFTMVLVVRSTDNDAAALEKALVPLAEGTDLVITARPVGPAHLDVALPTHVVSVYGADKPGIVFRVADVLARNGANIRELTSRVVGDETSPVYALMLEVTLTDVETTSAELDALHGELDVEVSVHPLDIDVL